MKKKTFYFPHDYNARNNPKIIKLMRIHGLAGVGAYWCIVEQLYQNGGNLPLDECENIAFALHTDCDCISSVIKDFGLFNNDGVVFWSDCVNKRLNRSREITEIRKNAIMKRWRNANAIQMNQESETKRTSRERHYEKKYKFRFVPKESLVHDEPEQVKIEAPTIVTFEVMYRGFYKGRYEVEAPNGEVSDKQLRDAFEKKHPTLRNRDYQIIITN